MTANGVDFPTAAATAYDALKGDFPKEPTGYWWRAGNAFDTAIDYLATLGPTSQEPIVFAEIANNKYPDQP